MSRSADSPGVEAAATRPGLSLVIPAFNEEEGIGAVLAAARTVLEGLGVEHEILVVDDCSSDATAAIAEAAGGARVVRNVQNGGYGYSLMRGITSAAFDTIAIADADGSYAVEDLARLYSEYRRGFAMVVGHRQGVHYDGTTGMRLLRAAFRGLAQFIVGRTVPDVNSGLRIFDRASVLPLLPHMSYGFSFTTSITLLFMMRALPVAYVPVGYRKRSGQSKVRYFRDALRALQIITSITARLNPIKLFLLAAVTNVVLMLPVLGVLACRHDVAIPVVIVLQTSALLVGLGLVVQALVDKKQLP